MIRALGLAVALLLALAAPAAAGILAPEDAAELAQSLAEAEDEQGVCYGWNVTNNFDATPDVGSGTSGPGVIMAAPQCKRGWVQLEGDINYSCATCDAPDRATVSISSSFPNPPTRQDLEDLGLEASALTGPDDDTTLLNMVNALPLLVADRGLAPYMKYEAARVVPAADHATDSPGSDFIREAWLQLLLCAGLIAAGAIFYLYKRDQLKKLDRRDRIDQPDQSTA